MLPTLAAQSVHTCVTSPPYWGLRSYNGGVAEIGIEQTPKEYVENLVTVFREVWRVLRKDGTLWLNLGDCYATGAGKVGEHPGGEQGERWKGYRGTRGESPKHASGAIGPMTQPNRMPQPGLKPKDLVGIPWMAAFALRDDGWWLRSDCIWSKPNPMPESVRDRPTKAHEYIFLLSKSATYYYDADAIKEPTTGHQQGTKGVGDWNKLADHADLGIRHGQGASSLHSLPETGRNKRSVWTVVTTPYKGAHFATFPPALIEPCILAGAPVGGVVLDPFCGSGTTLAVAAQHGRDSIGIELNPAYCDLARERHARATDQQRLPMTAMEPTHKAAEGME